MRVRRALRVCARVGDHRAPHGGPERVRAWVSAASERLWLRGAPAAGAAGLAAVSGSASPRAARRHTTSAHRRHNAVGLSRSTTRTCCGWSAAPTGLLKSDGDGVRKRIPVGDDGGMSTHHPYPGIAVLTCRVIEPDKRCRRCGARAAAGHCDPAAGARAAGLAATSLEVIVDRSSAPAAGRCGAETPAAPPNRRRSSHVVGCAERSRRSSSSTSLVRSAAWNTAINAVLAVGKRCSSRTGAGSTATVVGVDERLGRHTRRRDKASPSSST